VEVYLMCKLLRILLCVLIIAALSVPAFGASRAKQPSVVSGVAGGVYHGGATVVQQTEGIVSSCLKNTFSIFNPCLDFVKGCTKVVLMPIEKPLDYIEGAVEKRWPSKKTAVRVPVTPKSRPAQ
jgi:hypothetical protein